MKYIYKQQILDNNSSAVFVRECRMLLTLSVVKIQNYNFPSFQFQILQLLIIVTYINIYIYFHIIHKIYNFILSFCD